MYAPLIPEMPLATGIAPAFFSQVAVLLVASALVAYICHRFRIMPIVSFLLTGAVLGPHALGLIEDEAFIHTAAEVGVLLLLFVIGIEFSLARLARIQRLIFVGGGLQVILVVLLVTLISGMFEVNWRTGVFTGFLLALSSTAIVMKLLMDRAETNTEEGQAALGILIFQDLAVVAMVLLVPVLGSEGVPLLDIGVALGKAGGIVLLVLLAARKLMPRLLEAVARTCSQEIFLLTVVAICFGTAFLTSMAGVSLSLGAFLAGLLVSESRLRDMAFGEILPLQILFSATFFISVGLLLDWGFVFHNPLLVLALIGCSLVVKIVTTGISLRFLGYGTGAATFTGLLLAQVGEFSFVLERSGHDVGLYPVGLEAGSQAFIATTVLLMLVTPGLSRLGELIRARKSNQSTKHNPSAVSTPRAEIRSVRLKKHVLIAGYGVAGRRLATVLETHQVPFLIMTFNPDGALEAEKGSMNVLLGNYTRRHELTQAGIQDAGVMVVADDDLETTKRVVSAARALNPDLAIYVRTQYETEIEELKQAGATLVIAEDQESIIRLVSVLLEEGGVDPMTIRDNELALRTGSETAVPRTFDRSLSDITIQLDDRQKQSPGCLHTSRAQPVHPSTTGCQECMETGDEWVHLRICMICGHVGCCDSSKNKHARKHFHTTGHPIVKSYEPHENWAWCFEDESFL